MVQKATKFTDNDIMAYIDKNTANIRNLSKKFYYFTYLKKADLLQEGRLKIIELLRAFESGKLGCGLDSLDRYIGRSLVNHYVSLVRRFPADEYFDPKKFAFSHGTESDDLDVLIIHSMLSDLLTDKEYDVAELLLEGYPRREIAAILEMTPRSVSYVIQCIREKLKKQTK